VPLLRPTDQQQALHGWRSVVDDVGEAGIETIGVMVTTAGYQSGAQRVADSYGIVILELRARPIGIWPTGGGRFASNSLRGCRR
jgi:hypothetical protein